MAGSYCRVETRGRILIVTITRPDVMNALHRPANLELEAVFDGFARDPDLWVAIITGAGDRAFCAGNDLKYQAAGNDTTMPPTGFGGLTARFDLMKPVIAAVNGIALGGGFEIALACDLIVAARGANFGLPEPHVGLAATAGGLLRLAQQIPTKKAAEIILTARRVPAAEGEALGFVNALADTPAETLPAALALADRLLAGSPMAVRAAKELMLRAQDGDDLATLYARQRTYPAVRALYDSADRVEGPRAFAEKRKPVWTGR
ncbi:enoyl-CoA hydratase-related protein [Aquabacter spiritensis]|uniref:Short chain enoyl-CoA hydratase n=1 Tax=Aquabacter spiritensis TaxID=933073 RepID=A0A4R3LXQ7_9HYPH|nr:enoyl-CoA hydratase-related protein [Aquabacter spiritensis]TCT04996.1 short chain enoyl-CoA hydratase [Aquabacter spiritensis]